ncbi:transmembrane protein, putative (macronuclear) [Tetrahymena thermophila SB210]|uniref:Transmembrane protein, putative n=1 Tax=Tetrahymena thermophila (strain SB210) TaxID=312017 RepID=I7MJ77_TETTS|nr:transmembrane protein, putative [Tetrahymena thermophila SB210]EAS05965.2 transmembrane protein, putative [Tetrahymena thermophila SB210]|eukprot:XP_001026210.2 transmembrane protein, putative [Tetrahymena thermophila SB210]
MIIIAQQKGNVYFFKQYFLFLCYFSQHFQQIELQQFQIKVLISLLNNLFIYFFIHVKIIIFCKNKQKSANFFIDNFKFNRNSYIFKLSLFGGINFLLLQTQFFRRQLEQQLINQFLLYIQHLQIVRMNIKEELKKSVPYKSLKNVKKKSYDHSSDENDLEMGFPIQQNVHTYNILKDQQGLSKIKQILEGTQKQEYNLYEYLTIFEELTIILHFASHQNDTFIKKIKQLSQILGRDEKFLSEYIEDISYFNRFSQKNFNLLIKKLKQDTDLTLTQRIKWVKQLPFTNNMKTVNQLEYVLEVFPNTIKNILNDQSNSLIEKQSINSEQIYLEGQNSFNQKELSEFFFKQDHNEKLQKAKDLFQNKVRQLRKNPVNSYFDSDSNDNDENDNTQQQIIKKPHSQSQKFNKINFDDQKRYQEIQESENDSQELQQQKDDDYDENQNGQKNKNSLNALLAKVIQFDGQDQSDTNEQNQQEIEFQKYPFDSMLRNDLMSLSEYQKCIENIQKNQQLTVKQFLLKKSN